MLSLFQKIFSNEAGQPWHGHASESGLPQMILLWDALEAEGWRRGCPSWRSEQALQEHADPHFYFPATVQLESYKASFSPCRQVAKTTKIKTPTKVLAGYVNIPSILPQNPVCFPADINAPLPEGGATAGSTPQPEQQCQGTAPVTLFLSPLAFSTHLLNPKCQLYPFVVRQDPALQLFCCKPKGKAKSVCVSLILTTIMFTSGGMLSTQEHQQISMPEKTDLPLPPCAFSPHLPSHGRRKEA